MPDPVLVPPVPTINQSDSPEEIARVGENVQKIFDRVTPKIRGTPTPESQESVVIERPQLEKQATETPPAPVEQPAATQESAPEKPAEERHKVPSFIEKALEVPEVKPEQPSTTQPSEEDWPEELPTFKSSDEAKQRYKTWREKYNALKQEAKQLRERPVQDETTAARVQLLESQNKELQTQLSRFGVEHHQEFQNKIVRPMQAAWNEAARIVKDAGGDPQELAKALALSGRAQFDALDSVLADMPESAKIEAHDAIRSWRKANDARQAALANAPQTAQQLQKLDLERQYQQVTAQKKEMEQLWEEAGRKLREEAKVEVMQKSTDPDAKWWNDQADQIEQTSKQLFLENTDMGKVAIAMRLAPMVDVYRKLWLQERSARNKTDKILRDKFGSEPNLSESGGNNGGTPPVQEDLKKPFTDVFLREFHKHRNAGVR